MIVFTSKNTIDLESCFQNWFVYIAIVKGLYLLSCYIYFLFILMITKLYTRLINDFVRKP